MTRTLRHGSVRVRVVGEDVCMCVYVGGVAACQQGPVCISREAQRGKDLIWRVPQPLFPTICMLHCQEGGERGDL